MALKPHVVSLEVAKRLKKYRPEGWGSCFAWCIVTVPWLTKPQISLINHHDFQKTNGGVRELYSAQLFTELWKLLPVRIDEKWWLHADKAGVHYIDDKFKWLHGVHTDDNTNLATASAELLMWLVDNKYVSIGGVTNDNNISLDR